MGKKLAGNAGIRLGLGRGRRRSNALHNRISGWANALLHIFFLICAFACLYPLLLVIGISFTANDALRDGYSVIPRVFSLEGYSFAFGIGKSILRAYGITMLVTAAGTAGHVLFCAAFAYPLSRPRFQSRKFFMGVLLVPMLFSGGMVPWYVICTQVLRLKNTIWALILPTLFSPWNTLVLRTFYKNNIPPSLIDAARIDGCGEIMTFFRIVLPLSKAGLATIGFLTGLGIWNDYWNSLMLITNEKLYSLQYLLYNIMQKIQFLSSLTAQRVGITASDLSSIPQETARMAMCVLTIGPIILAYPYFQRFFVKGITVGSIKG